jgi:SAM-dependent methyltransferase
MAPRNLDRLTTVYGPTTWDVYERLDGSLQPEGPDSLHSMAAEFLQPGGVILDAGCRDAEHLIRLVQDHALTGVGVDPVEIHIQRGRSAVEAAGLGERIRLHRGVMHELPYHDDNFDLVWCRDVLEQVDDLDGAFQELLRVMKPTATLLAYTTFATDLLDGHDAEMMRRHMGNIERNLDMDHMEQAFGRAGLNVERKVVVGTEWREYAEERTQPASLALLRLARLRRQRATIVDAHGQDVYDHIEANLHWEVFQFLGKLVPVVYVLTPQSGGSTA